MSKCLTCAKCCTIFSVTGIFFLLIIGSLLQNQPLYIKGPTDYSAAAAGCFEGALIYFGTFLLSLGYWIYDSTRSGTALTGGRGATSSYDPISRPSSGKGGGSSSDGGASSNANAANSNKTSITSGISKRGGKILGRGKATSKGKKSSSTSSSVFQLIGTQDDEEHSVHKDDQEDDDDDDDEVVVGF